MCCLCLFFFFQGCLQNIWSNVFRFTSRFKLLGVRNEKESEIGFYMFCSRRTQKTRGGWRKKTENRSCLVQGRGLAGTPSTQKDPRSNETCLGFSFFMDLFFLTNLLFYFYYFSSSDRKIKKIWFFTRGSKLIKWNHPCFLSFIPPESV